MTVWAVCNRTSSRQVFFFPYRADLELLQVPLLTFLVCLLCALIYWAQASNEHDVIEKTESFCAEKSPRLYRIVVKKTTGRSAHEVCPALMFELRRAADPEQFIREKMIQDARIAGYSEDDGRALMTEAVLKQYQLYLRATPELLTASLWYQPETYNIVRMVTAAFAHGSWSHLIGNLFFFFAFAATVEVILGWWRYVALLLTLALGTHIAYAITSAGMEQALPTVGLSGVVMGMMGMFAWFLPAHGIRCFIWFFVVFTRVVIPAWILFAWYLGWDLFALAQGDKSGVNLVAHVSGAFIGYGLGFAFLRKRKRDILALNT